MVNEDYKSEVYELLRDLNSALAYRDYDFDYYDIIKKYGCKTLKEFIGFVFASILKRDYGVKDIEKIESFIL